jgi:hypothetical protein
MKPFESQSCTRHDLQRGRRALSLFVNHIWEYSNCTTAKKLYISSFGGNVFNFFIHYFFENCYNFPSVLVIMNLDYENVNLIDFDCGFETQKMSCSVLLSYFP